MKLAESRDMLNAREFIRYRARVAPAASLASRPLWHLALPGSRLALAFSVEPQLLRIEDTGKL
jgi:hypothetical protein